MIMTMIQFLAMCSTCSWKHRVLST